VSTETRSPGGFPLHVVAYARQAIEWLSFWAAVSLPFVSAGLVAGGLDTSGEALALCCLLVANLLALFGGRGYRSE
jgi:hypothetical protein